MPSLRTDLTPYLFLSILVIVGGVIAWVADSLGRRIGKKRLSFMGLRPRHTATLIIILAGILVPIITIAAMYVLSSDVREWIIKGRRAAVEAQADAKKYQDQAAKEEQRAANFELRNKDLEKSYQSLKGNLSQLKTLVAQTKGELTGTKKLLADAKADVSAKRREVAKKDSEIRAKQKEIQTKQVELVASQKELSKARETLRQVEITSRVAIRELNENKKNALELDQQNAALESQVDGLKGDLKILQAQKQTLQDQVNSYDSTIKGLQTNLKDLQETQTRLQNDIEYIQSQAGANFIVTRYRPMIFEYQEELSRIQLPPSLPPAAAKNAYFDLLQRSKAVALEHGARNLATLPPAGIQPRNITDSNGKKRFVSTEEQEDAIIRGLIAQRSELIFIAKAGYNAFEGEFVPLEFVAYRNKDVYTPGQVIIETRIDGRKLESEILQAVQQFISVNVRAKALSDGMVPPSGRNSSLGKVDGEEILNMVRDLKYENKIVRLQALAKSATRAGDQLELTFRIKY
ncbi:MAG: DUF3084 domain-containing protein [Armatimonadetes bacterium]|nr:DUF3084 domain-containing protein [Armatimonadota bacterium]